MKHLRGYLYFIVAFAVTGCSMLKENGTVALQNGRFKTNISGRSQKCWVRFEDTLISLYPLQSENNTDKSNPIIFSFNEMALPGSSPSLNLSGMSFDFDVITIPFKYRPAVKGVSNQFNTNFSGAVYAGILNDFYHFYYRTNPIGEQRRKMKHFGIGFGLINGFGSTIINEWTTHGQVLPEYEGFVFMSGAAAIVASNKLNFGLALGTDFLIDRNAKYWDYQRKPWFGLTLGLNLN
jgi:hypothetical protein